MRIFACGEALFSSRNLAARIDQRLVDGFLQADAVFANAEFCCPKSSTPPVPCGFTTAVGPEVLDEFVDLNIKLVNFAHNHTGDFGWQGVVDTIEAAEARGLVYCGIGRSLEEARAARFLDTPKGRIGVVAASSTRSEKFAASSPGIGIAPRPGLNPLHWGRAYVLPDQEFQQLQRGRSGFWSRDEHREGAAADCFQGCFVKSPDCLCRMACCASIWIYMLTCLKFRSRICLPG